MTDCPLPLREVLFCPNGPVVLFWIAAAMLPKDEADE